MKKKARPTLLLLLQLSLIFTALELAASLVYRLKHGRSIQSQMRVIPHDPLVFQKNPELDGDPFRIPPESTGADKVRILVLGASTSQTEPYGNDWPAAFEKLFPSAARARTFIINMSVGGYGSSQVRWVYERYRDEVRPDIVIIFDGWNYRGAMTTPHAYVPPNTCSRFSGPLRCGSAWLVRHSTLYALLAAAVDARRARTRGLGREFTSEERASMTAECAAWELELRDLLTVATRRDRVFLVLFPGLAMRADARAEASGHLPGFARHWESARFDYDLRMAALLRAASASGVRTLDARPAYLRLPAGRFVSFFIDSMHQTPEGNRFLAETLYRELGKHGRGGLARTP